MRLRDRIGLTDRRQRQLTRAMQVSLLVLIGLGLERGSLGIVVNATIGLGVTQLPAVLERDYHIPMDSALTLWITAAVFLHALGTAGLPGAETNFYRSIPWWDHLTHTLSSSIVAAAGYATARAVELHSDAVSLPDRFMFVFILLFVLAFGVFWEVIEFAVAGAAALSGTPAVLVQYGLEDTMLDLLFDTLGGVVVAVWGTAHLTDVVGAIAERLGRTDA
ncbi:hypothetical protein DU500_15725 [Haloplanus rubicundus]|uniref:DUF2238 domain-containing protein n=1 Tax=Haloplanus rubicundus TaxID=1547898 RepID=A0A345E6D7_9EURY|nr:hypothetical protein [Haloplanus rubicundus]AXG07759.1 hypothetical protein DU500_15725 [Haloplanus rubicundus]AXG11176.1 hypothetical protein DU484_15705 [Haloplanus rubicundus]